MKILIDFTQIPLQKVGVGVYALNLVKEIAKLDYENRYYIIIQDDEHSLDDIENQNFKFILVQSKIFRKLIFRFFLEQFIIPYIAIRDNINIIHSLHYSIPLFATGVKRIVTIHDMIFFKFPQYHELIKKYYFRFFTRLSAKLADRIIAISESTKKDFLAIAGAKKDKVVLIYLGKENWSHCTFTSEKIEFIKDKYGIKGQYLLFIGTIEPRKNLVKLIDAFKKLLKAEKKYQLVIVGKRGWGYKEIYRKIDDHGLGDEIIFTGFVEEVDKPYIIKGSKIFIYPSLYEGFGIPVLEALTLGVPTITSNVSSMPEIAGNAAFLVDPTDEKAIYSAIKQLLSNQKLYLNYNKRSIIQANKFSWAKTASQTIELYRSLS